MLRKVAVIFHFLGPYHLARLSASAEQLNIVAVELSGRTRTYGWEHTESPSSIECVTIFSDSDCRECSASKVVAQLGAALDRIRPDIVVVPGWSEAAALGALEWALQARVPTVLMSESTSWDEPRLGWREAIKREITKLFGAALVGGRPHLEYAMKLGMPRDRIFLGYDAVDNGYFARQSAAIRKGTGHIRTQLRLPAHYFLASARFVEKKNLRRLLQAYAEYRRRGEAAGDLSKSKCQSPGIGAGLAPAVRFSATGLWDLVVLGDGPKRLEVGQLISELQLQSFVRLPGFKKYTELPAYYGLASAFVHASTTEQWGLVVNEAMASGLPVLVSNRCGCAPNLVHDGVNGFVFDPYNVDEIARLMLRVAGMEEEARRRMGIESAEIVSNWGPERFASGLKDAVECALEVGPKRTSMFDRMVLRALIHR